MSEHRPLLSSRFGSVGFVLPALTFLLLFFAWPMLSLLRYSFGLDQIADSPAAARFTGELTSFSTTIWGGLLGADISPTVFGLELGQLPLWTAVLTCGTLVVGIRIGWKSGTPGRWLAASCGLLLVAPFMTIPIGSRLVRIAEFSSSNESLHLFFRSVTIAMTGAAWSVAVALPIAYYLAFIGRRRRYTWLLVILASFLASYLLRIFAWKLILGNQGLVAQAIGEGATPSFLLYSQFTVILVLIYLWVPVVVLPIFVAFDGIDRSLLEAGSNLGASRLQLLRKVILPTAAPGIVAGFLLAFIPSLGEYVTPSLVGGNNGYMFGQAVADHFVGNARNWQAGSVLAMLLLAVVLFVMWVSRRGSGSNVMTAGGAGTPRQWTENMRATVASPGAEILLRICFVAFMLFLYLPIAVLIVTSFNGSAIPTFPPDDLSFEWYQRAWDQPGIRSALWASLRVGVISALVAGILAVLASYAIARRELRGRGLMAAMLALPLVVPPVVLGVSLLSLFQGAAVPVPLGLLAVSIAHVVFVLPYCVLILLPRLQSLDKRLEEAAQDLGATWVVTFRRVLLPMLAPSLAAALIVGFVLSLDEVVIASFLVQDDPTYPVYLFTALRVADRTMLVLPVAAVMMVASLLLVASAEIIRWRSERIIVAVQNETRA